MSPFDMVADGIGADTDTSGIETVFGGVGTAFLIDETGAHEVFVAGIV